MLLIVTAIISTNELFSKNIINTIYEKEQVTVIFKTIKEDTINKFTLPADVDFCKKEIDIFLEEGGRLKKDMLIEKQMIGLFPVRIVEKHEKIVYIRKNNVVIKETNPDSYLTQPKTDWLLTFTTLILLPLFVIFFGKVLITPAEFKFHGLWIGLLAIIMCATLIFIVGNKISPEMRSDYLLYLWILVVVVSIGFRFRKQYKETRNLFALVRIFSS